MGESRDRIRVLFFGIIAEKVGAKELYYEGVADTEALRKRVAESLPGLEKLSYRISVNREMVSETLQLKEGDEVAFLPPFAGG